MLVVVETAPNDPAGTVEAFQVYSCRYRNEGCAKLAYWRIDRALDNGNGSTYRFSYGEEHFVAVVREVSASDDPSALFELPWLDGVVEDLAPDIALALVERRVEKVQRGTELRYRDGVQLKQGDECPCGSGIAIAFCTHLNG
jgi:hypothetical protein